MEHTKRLFFAMWCLTQRGSRKGVYTGFAAAIEAAISEGDFEAAAAFRDIRESLLGTYKPSDEQFDLIKLGM